jgi:hypothetical protein
MVDDLLSGRVTSFRREQGFGVITLDDGRDVKFDASSCTMVPEEGAAVRLRIAPARWGGGFKALHVEEGSASSLFVAAPVTLEQQVAALQREHLVGALSEAALAQLITDAFGGRRAHATLLAVVDAFYRGDPAAAQHDGYLRHDAPLRHETTDVLAEVAALVPGGAVPRRLAWDAGASALRVQLPDRSERSVAGDALGEIVTLVNDALAASADPRRLYALNTAGTWHAWLVLTEDRARRLAGLLPFAK